MQNKNQTIYGSSFEEIRFYYYIKKVFPDAIHRYKFVKELQFEQQINKHFELDIFIPDINLGIEYDGVFYHKKKNSKKNDIFKEKILKTKNIDLIRIREKGLYSISDNNFEYDPRKQTFINTITSILDFILYKYNLANSTIEAINNLKHCDFNDDIELIRKLHKKEQIKNSILNLKPHLAKEWHPIKNGDLKPEHVTPGSTVKIWWICEFGNEFLMSPHQRRNMKTCPCHAYNSHKIHELNNFLNLNEELSKEWHPTLNFKNTLANIFPSSKEKYWWICEKGHEYESTPFQRHYSKQGCPYCRGLKVCLENCLSTLKPDIANQWHVQKNGELTPKMVTISSGKRVWWKCEICEHEWEANINNRVRTSGKCPNCRKK